METATHVTAQTVADAVRDQLMAGVPECLEHMRKTTPRTDPLPHASFDYIASTSADDDISAIWNSFRTNRLPDSALERMAENANAEDSTGEEAAALWLRANDLAAKQFQTRAASVLLTEERCKALPEDHAVRRLHTLHGALAALKNSRNVTVTYCTPRGTMHTVTADRAKLMRRLLYGNALVAQDFSGKTKELLEATFKDGWVPATAICRVTFRRRVLYRSVASFPACYTGVLPV